ncbi:uncharacterized protein BKCO1_1200030 [Diplodia corticola]|uniref:Uncharacterized protein n=1 Tax=Diplodia corticola TaxID=236234 RepID=A0A1J9R709_9PEZI|nr:uncharacterized protein BKCO1_1200030 [Diplodia corticola]OJD36321.1 hypothetical protein BKCO1_1200030 [Diplodia corticola]
MWGRGGAGNIQQAAEANKQRASETQDLEAANPTTSAATDDSAAAANTAAASQEYAHMGRGGAGNFYSPAALSSTGTFVNDPTTASTTNPSFSTAEPPPAPLSNLDSSSNWWNTAKTSSSSSSPTTTTTPSAPTSNSTTTTGTSSTTSSVPVARTGRGGAGNYVWGTADVSERRAEQIRREWGELRERERGVRKKVAEDVELAVPKPPSAVLGGPGRGTNGGVGRGEWE